jgi:hypothetical protein
MYTVGCRAQQTIAFLLGTKQVPERNADTLRDLVYTMALRWCEGDEYEARRTAEAVHEWAAQQGWPYAGKDGHNG